MLLVVTVKNNLIPVVAYLFINFNKSIVLQGIDFYLIIW